MNLEPAVGVGSKNPLFGYDLLPLASYVINFKSLGPKLWKFFLDIDQIGPVKYKSIDSSNIFILTKEPHQEAVLFAITHSFVNITPKC